MLLKEWGYKAYKYIQARKLMPRNMCKKSTREVSLVIYANIKTNLGEADSQWCPVFGEICWSTGVNWARVGGLFWAPLWSPLCSFWANMLEHRGRLGAGWWRSARFGLSSLRGRGRGARDPGAGSREAEQRAPPRFAVFSGGNAKNFRKKSKQIQKEI